MITVVAAKYLKDYKIEVVFSDNLQGIVDLENVIKNDHRSIFYQLKDKKKFSDIKIELDTISWSNGLDLAPEFLHDLLKKQNKLTIKTKVKCQY